MGGVKDCDESLALDSVADDFVDRFRMKERKAKR